MNSVATAKDREQLNFYLVLGKPAQISAIKIIASDCLHNAFDERLLRHRPCHPSLLSAAAVLTFAWYFRG